MISQYFKYLKYEYLKLFNLTAIKNYRIKYLNIANRVNSNTNFKEFSLLKKFEAFKTFSTSDI